MNRLRAFLTFMGSKTLTVWLVGLFVVYYLTMAVWSKEAFATYVTHLSGNNLFRLFYLIFFVNVTSRVAAALRILWSNKVRLVLRLPLYAGLVILLFSFFMSLNIREHRWLLIGEGDVLDISWENTKLRVIHVEPALKKKALRTDDAAIFDYEPSVTLMERNGERHTIGAFPPMLVGSTFMHVLNFGIAPGVELKKDNEVVARGEVALRLTPFGSVDNFEMAPFPYKFYVSILPNRIIKKGRETARDYDLDKPLYQVDVVKGDAVIARGETDGGMLFDGNMAIRFLSPSDWVLLEVAYDPFLPSFAAGLLLLLAGGVLYPFSLLLTQQRDKKLPRSHRGTERTG